MSVGYCGDRKFGAVVTYLDAGERMSAYGTMQRRPERLKLGRKADGPLCASISDISMTSV